MKRKCNQFFCSKRGSKEWKDNKDEQIRINTIIKELKAETKANIKISTYRKDLPINEWGL